MDALKDFELKLVQRIVDRSKPDEEWLTADQLHKLKPFLEDMGASRFVSYEYTVIGYFATFSHPKIPDERIVVSDRSVGGEIDGNPVGFALFFEAGELTIDCHSLSEHDCPIDARDRGIAICDWRTDDCQAEKDGDWQA